MGNAAERKRKERAGMREKHFVIVSEWVHKDDADRARKYLEILAAYNMVAKRCEAAGVASGA